MPEELKCYASGDGALHFVYIENDKATGRRPTLEDARLYLETDPNSAGLRMDNWEAVMLNSQPVLVANVMRIDDNTLSVDGEHFTYAVDPENYFWVNGKQVIDHALTLTVIRDEKPVNVVNYSLRAQVRHFLNNEEQLRNRPRRDPVGSQSVY